MTKRNRNEGIIQAGGVIYADRIAVGKKARAIRSTPSGGRVPDHEGTSQAQANVRIRPVRIFYSYSYKDETLRDAMEAHLAVLKQQGMIESWHNRCVTAGEEWEGQVAQQMEIADIILLLISADFLSSSYCYKIEMQRALARHKAGEARVIPVIVRPVLWDRSPFSKLLPLPRDGKPVTSWPNPDEAWLDVAQSIRQLVDDLIHHMTEMLRNHDIQ